MGMRLGCGAAKPCARTAPSTRVAGSLGRRRPSGGHSHYTGGDVDLRGTLALLGHKAALTDRDGLPPAAWT